MSARDLTMGTAHTPRGLPGRLPEGEVLLWSGTPNARVLARSALHVRKLAIYFAIIVAWTAVATGSVLSVLEAAGLGAIPVGLALLYAWLVSRMAVYSITNRRVVMHIGLALPVTLNLPLARIASADVRGGLGRSGDLSLTLSGQDRFAYAVLWPHARPWRFAPAQPTLRGLADVAEPAHILAQALAAATDRTARPPPPLQATMAA